MVVEPLHRHHHHGLELALVGVGDVHQVLDGTADGSLLVGGEGTEPGGILAHQVSQVGKHLAGAVATLHRALVHILTEGIVGGTEKAAVDDVHVGIVAGIAQGVRAVFGPQVVGQSVHGAKVGKGALVALGHRGQLLVVEPEGEGFAILADEHIGTLDELGLGDGLQTADIGDGLLGQLLVLGRGFLEVLIGLLDAFHLLVAELEGLHEGLDDRTGEALAAGGFGHHQHLQQQGVGFEVVGVLEAQACGQGAIAVNGGEDGRYLEGCRGGVPEGPYCRWEVGGRKSFRFHRAGARFKVQGICLL